MNDQTEVNDESRAEGQSLLNDGLGALLYKLRLHDVLGVHKHFEVMRVPGGWLYINYFENGMGGWSNTTCFVPFNNEFQDVPTAMIYKPS